MKKYLGLFGLLLISSIALGVYIEPPYPFVNGGTNATTQQGALNSIVGSVTSGSYPRGNGTNVVMSPIQVADVPTLNQNTTGSAASFTGSLVGDVSGTQGATSVNKINGIALSGLSTGLLKNTTVTGAPSIASYADVVALFSTCSGTQYLGADGSCHSGGGSPGGATTDVQYNNAGAFAGNSSFVYNGTGVGIGTSSPSASSDLTLAAGTSTVAPMIINPGSNLTSPTSGAIENNGTNLYYTDSGNNRHPLFVAPASDTHQGEFLQTPSTNTYQWAAPNQGFVNLLLNGGFSAPTAATSWTTANMTAITDTTNYHSGSQSFQASMSSQAGTLTQDVTPPQQLDGNMEASCWVKTSLSTVTVCGRSGGSNLSSCTSVPSSNAWTYVPFYFPAPSNGTSVGVQVATTSTSGTYNVADCYLGSSRLNVQNQTTGVTNWTAFTMNVTSASGTNPTKGSSPIIDSARWRRVGDSMEIEYNYQQSSATGAVAGSDVYLFALPSSYTIDTTKIEIPGSITNYPIVGSMNESNNTGFGGTQTLGWVAPYDSSHLYLTGLDSSSDYTSRCQVGGGSAPNECAGVFTSTGFTVSFKATVPISQFSQMAVLQTTDQSDFGWTDYSSSFTANGMGTTTNKFFAKRIGDTLYVNGVITTGTTTASIASISLPSQWVIDSTKLSSTTSASLLGFGTASGGSSGAFIAGAGVVYFYDGSDTANVYLAIDTNSSTSLYAKVNGSDAFNNSQPISVNFSVPISGWANTNRAPQLINSVTTTSATKTFHLESVSASGAGGAGTSCTSSPCTLLNPSDAVTSVTRTSTGLYVVNFAAGTFANAPNCSATANYAGGSVGELEFPSSPTPTATSIPVDIINLSAVPEDGGFSIICHGSK